MLKPINLLPQSSQRVMNHYGRWALISVVMLLIGSLLCDVFWAYASERLQNDMHAKQADLKRWQPQLQLWQQAKWQQRHATEVKRWHQQWYCQWQNLLNTAPPEMSWQLVVFDIDHCQVQGVIPDPAVLSQWSQRMTGRIDQQHIKQRLDSTVWDFDVDLKWL